MSRQFRPGIVPSIAAGAMVALTCYLGFWQNGRAEEKLALQVAMEQRSAQPRHLLGPLDRDGQALQYRQVSVLGQYLPAKQLFVDNKHHGGIVGFHVVTPLQLEGSDAVVLVNRGWVGRESAYPRTPKIAVPAGSVEVTGMAVLPVQRFVELSGDTVQGKLWQNLTIARARSALGLDVLPIIVLSSADEPGLVPVRESPDAGIDRHRGYALQWFSLAALVIVLWVVLNIRKDSL